MCLAEKKKRERRTLKARMWNNLRNNFLQLILCFFFPAMCNAMVFRHTMCSYGRFQNKSCLSVRRSINSPIAQISPFRHLQPVPNETLKLVQLVFAPSFPSDRNRTICNEKFLLLLLNKKHGRECYNFEFSFSLLFGMGMIKSFSEWNSIDFSI